LTQKLEYPGRRKVIRVGRDALHPITTRRSTLMKIGTTAASQCILFLYPLYLIELPGHLPPESSVLSAHSVVIANGISQFFRRVFLSW
jgi:hypothetical protein